ncbi:hypothetical protein LU604_15495 [Erwinia tracheiphila]|uniref:Uncharacterized protein n=1 Tax=Erwinia tracheiphila TaxID=65700 RepID=A0A345CPP6_9GAMM|nr:hypothetical protein [Erwinia tracheiphila]AXF75413.1 hypothetical protein AV903_03695 [Erwinia tracheiphila]AXF76076.1 hypothetical protein AV903_08470 [Erwinia tracheiphila]UIA82040.1 hypothetical protein LU604_15495 [Erwinia tracheiphila]
MRKTWFTHDPVDTDTANELLSRYASRNIQTQKTLSTDPRHWIVSALLPEFEQVPRQERTYQQSIWG